MLPGLARISHEELATTLKGAVWGGSRCGETNATGLPPSGSGS